MCKLWIGKSKVLRTSRKVWRIAKSQRGGVWKCKTYHKAKIYGKWASNHRPKNLASRGKRYSIYGLNEVCIRNWKVPIEAKRLGKWLLKAWVDEDKQWSYYPINEEWKSKQRSIFHWGNQEALIISVNIWKLDLNWKLG